MKNIIPRTRAPFLLTWRIAACLGRNRRYIRQERDHVPTAMTLTPQNSYSLDRTIKASTLTSEDTPIDMQASYDPTVKCAFVSIFSIFLLYTYDMVKPGQAFRGKVKF